MAPAGNQALDTTTLSNHTKAFTRNAKHLRRHVNCSEEDSTELRVIRRHILEGIGERLPGLL